MADCCSFLADCERFLAVFFAALGRLPIVTKSIRSFFQEREVSDEILNCEYEGVLGTVAGIIGTILANEVLKKILNIGKNLNGYILIIDLLNLNFRKVKLSKVKNV